MQVNYRAVRGAVAGAGRGWWQMRSHGDPPGSGRCARHAFERRGSDPVAVRAPRGTPQPLDGYAAPLFCGGEAYAPSGPPPVASRIMRTHAHDGILSTQFSFSFSL